MKRKQQTQNTKVGGRGNNLKLKAQSLKREFISRFQLLIIYINSMQKVNKKVGGMFSEIRSRKVGRGLRNVGVMGVVFVAVMPATRERRERSHDSAKALAGLLFVTNRKALGQIGSSRRMTANGAEAT